MNAREIERSPQERGHDAETDGGISPCTRRLRLLVNRARKEMRRNKKMVRIPQIASIETAIRIYYERIELKNADIMELFGMNLSRGKIVKMKEAAKEIMDEENILSYDATAVNTDAAYRAWGLNIDDLERRLKKLKAYGLQGGAT